MLRASNRRTRCGAGRLVFCSMEPHEPVTAASQIRYSPVSPIIKASRNAPQSQATGVSTRQGPADKCPGCQRDARVRVSGQCSICGTPEYSGRLVLKQTDYVAEAGFTPDFDWRDQTTCPSCSRAPFNRYSVREKTAAAPAGTYYGKVGGQAEGVTQTASKHCGSDFGGGRRERERGAGGGGGIVCNPLCSTLHRPALNFTGIR